VYSGISYYHFQIFYVILIEPHFASFNVFWLQFSKIIKYLAFTAHYVSGKISTL